MNEPPLSPGGPDPTPPPTAQAPSLEAQVVRLGLMTTAEVATTMQEEAETGRPFAELAVEHGRIAADDLARLTEAEAAPAPPAPELELAPPALDPPALAPPVPDLPVPEPERETVPPPALLVPEPRPEPQIDTEPEPDPVVKIAVEPPAAAPAPASTPRAAVFVRLTSGERVSAGEFESQEAAERRARELMIAIDAHGDWPCVDGRFIKPDAVVSIDVDLATN